MKVWQSTQKESVMPGLVRFGVRKNLEPCAIRYTEERRSLWIACPKSRTEDADSAIKDSQIATPAPPRWLDLLNPCLEVGWNEFA